MPKFHRSSAAPPGALIETRNPRLYGSRDEQIEAFAERSRGCPDPERAVIYTRRRRTRPSERTTRPAQAAVDCTPREHARKRELLEHNFAALSAQVQAARAAGDEERRAALAARARALRAELLKLTGGVERREVEVDQGSAVNPMVAV